MTKIKVSILDENTLSLLENGLVGDTIALNDLHDQDIDKEFINNSIKTKIKNEVAFELEKIQKQVEAEKNSELKIALLEKEKIIKESFDIKTNDLNNRFNKEIAELKIKLEEKDIKLGTIIKEKEQELEIEKNKLLIAENTRNAALVLEIEKLKQENENLQEKNEKEIELIRITTETKLKDEVKEQEFEIKKLKQEKEQITEKITNKLLLDFNEKENKYKYELEIKEKDISLLKDLNLKKSTKMIGETLEKHCEIEFNRIRDLLPSNIYFDKDNDVTTGSKGDYIFKEFDEKGNLVLSIMFEMKNEVDTTVTKHKNSDFFKELDKDRNEKGCEYAILVSLLEKDNELYNDGIYTVPENLYKDMYVIRPQYFIQIITLLRKTSKKTLELRNEIEMIKGKNLDITNFETNLGEFKEKFGRNYHLASDKFKDAIDRIDKTIDNLQKIKSDLIGSENNLRLANNKLEDLSLKKIAKDSPSILEQVDNEIPTEVA